MFENYRDRSIASTNAWISFWEHYIVYPNFDITKAGLTDHNYNEELYKFRDFIAEINGLREECDNEMSDQEIIQENITNSIKEFNEYSNKNIKLDSIFTVFPEEEDFLNSNSSQFQKWLRS